MNNFNFLTEKRKNNDSINPIERIKSYDEFHTFLDPKKRIIQASRCMNCGVPFCQSGVSIKGITVGCPLHNYIPEWNKLIASNHLEEAYKRLMITTSFPEFTGRVCPALCEAGCCNGINGEAVTIRDNELYIIEEAYKKGLVKPRLVEKRNNHKVAVVGSGPSGLALANELNQMGYNVTVYEKNDRFGGLLMYGIPNMKLDKKVITRRIDLLKKEGIDFVNNYDAIGNSKELLSNYDAVALATGSSMPRDLSVPGRNDEHVLFAVDFLTKSTKALLNNETFDLVKNKRVLVVGGGDTGNDCVGTCFRGKAKSVVQFEIMGKPDIKRTNSWPEWPNNLKVDYGAEESIAIQNQDQRIFNITIKEIIPTSDHLTVKAIKVKMENRKFVEIVGSEEVYSFDYIIIAMGFIGSSKDLVNSFAVESDQRMNINAKAYQTINEKVFTCGDARTGQSLVVKAINEGRQCAKAIDEYLR